MHRFSLKILKACVPLGLGLFIVHPIFNQDKEEPLLEKLSISKQSQLIKSLNQSIQDLNKDKANKDQKEPQKTQNQQNSSENQVKKQQNAHQQKKEVNVILDMQELFQNNTAFVCDSTPQKLIDYLRLQGINVIINNDLSQRRIKIKNKEGDIFVMQPDKNYLDYPENCLKLSNFLTSIRVISSLDQMKRILKILAQDEFLVVSFIPQQQDYIRSKISKSQYDSFTPQGKLNLKQIQNDFKQQKYESGSTKNLFVLIRDPEIAQFIKINPNKIGNRYLYYKSSFNNGMEVSTLLEGQKFTMKTIPFNAPNKNIMQTGIYSYLNVVNFQGDLQNLLKSISVKNGPGKILLVYSRQKRHQFINQVKSICVKAAKILKQEVVIVYTQNEKLLGKYFQVIPDEFVTIRLIDTAKEQKPMFTIDPFYVQKRKFYSRKLMTGPFTVQNICNFVTKKSEWKQYYQKNKRLINIQSIVSESEQLPNNTLVLHWKHGCRGCELTLDYLAEIKRILQNLNQQSRFKYEIERPEQLKKVNILRFNILNEQHQKNEKNHDVTPQLFLHTNGKKKSIEIGAIIGLINTINQKNENQVHQQIMKKIISQIERNMEQSHQLD